ncbi:type II secretion system protein GspC [Edwardsiella tarda]|uniref:type II secretion system protein GspC n=1 Tax=Edwardsiella tarda TaxID=636 RepID=UPI000D515E2C|nr:type II secretion system protein GspC [Edwardsiella tarda]UCQ26588.1 type II secretion system protein GspC [Edwardsiella tarda]
MQFLNKMGREREILVFNVCKKWLLKIMLCVLYVTLFFIFTKMTVSIWHYITFSTEYIQTSPVRLKERQRDAEKSDTEGWQLISQQNWFGEYLPAVVSEHSPAIAMEAETPLDIVLRGIAFGIRPGAVLDEGGKQQVYLQGDTLSSSNAVIDLISHDYVMLRYQGKIIRLTLADKGRSATTAKIDNETNTTAAQLPETFAVADTFASLPPAVQRALAIDPQKFFEYIRFIPVHKNGIAGYAVMPGADRSLFDISKLKVGDIAIALNEQDFTQPEAINIFMRQIYSMKSVKLTVLRRGERHNISVALY